MFKLASHIVAHGPLHPGDAVGWAVRLCLALEVIHGVRSSHGSISAKAVQMLGPSCHAAGFFLDGHDCVADILYQSPERLVGEAACPEDDTWAIGVLLYFALTGTYPFVAQTAPDLRARILWSKPKPLASYGLKSPCVQRVLDHVLAPDAAGRIQTVKLLRARLIECHPPAERLSALKLGKPDLRALSDETDDSQGVKLTGVISRGEMERQIRAVIEKRKAARAATGPLDPALEVDPWSEADTTRRRSAEPPTRVRTSSPEPPTVVRTASVVSSAAMQLPGAVGDLPLDDSTADTSVSGRPLPRSTNPPAAAVPALAQTMPTRVGIDPDATIQQPLRGGSGVQRAPASTSQLAWPPGSGVQARPSGSVDGSPLPISAERRVESGSGAIDVPISIDVSDTSETGKRSLGLSWDDLPESQVPAAARAMTAGLSDSHGGRGVRWVPPPMLSSDDSEVIPVMRPRWPKFLGAMLLVAVGGLLAYLVLGAGLQSSDADATSSTGGSSGSDPPPQATEPGASEQPPPAATAGASASGLATPSGAPVRPHTAAKGGTSGCVAGLFPGDTFRHARPAFEFVCSERDVHEGATAIRAELVRARSQPGASVAMRELDELGWYQLALFAAARALCCDEPLPLRTRAGMHKCPLDERLEGVGRAAASGDDRALQSALEHYVQAVRCLERQGAAAAFGPLRPPSSASAALLHKMLTRPAEAATR